MRNIIIATRKINVSTFRSRNACCNLLPNYRDTFLPVMKINEDNEDLNIYYG